jgi:putative FmdB family regulatory protein
LAIFYNLTAGELTMPIYEYVCDKCHSKEEIIQKFGEGVPEVCPKCQAKGTLKKAVTSSSFHLKGGGWYKDLYSSPKSSESTTKSPESSTTETAKEGKVEKPAKKTDDK